ncbi:MAG: hypothetical protein RL591_1547 [Planctomycetota bacterium]
MQSRGKYRRMRAMSTPLPRATTSLGLHSAAAVVFGVIATALMTYVPLQQVDRGRGAQIRQIYRGEYAWVNARDEAFGLAWSNLQLSPTRMTTPLTDGDLPSWAEPPPPPYPDVQFLRIGTLASGWPFPTVAFRWTVTTTKRNFPIHAELDDGNTSISHAAESVLTGGRGGAPEERRVLWVGALANVATFATAAFLLLTLVARMKGRAG